MDAKNDKYFHSIGKKTALLVFGLLASSSREVFAPKLRHVPVTVSRSLMLYLNLVILGAIRLGYVGSFYLGQVPVCPVSFFRCKRKVVKLSAVLSKSLCPMPLLLVV